MYDITINADAVKSPPERAVRRWRPSIPAAALGDDRLHPADFRVLGAVCSFVGADGDTCYPSITDLQGKLRSTVSRGQISKSTRRLESLGYLKITKAHGRNNYWVNFELFLPDETGVSPEGNTAVAPGGNSAVSSEGNSTVAQGETHKETQRNYPSKQPNQSSRSVRKGEFTDVALEICLAGHIRPERVRDVFDGWSTIPNRRTLADWCLIEREQSRLTPQHPNYKGEGHGNGTSSAPRVGPAANAAARKQTNRGFVRAVQGGH